MRWIGGAIALGFLALCILFVPVWEHAWTCVVCRLKRIDSRILGVAHFNFRPNECSRWYAEHVEPSHAHVWSRMAGEIGRNLFGLPVAVVTACYRPPIQALLPSTQMRVYQHFGDPLEARKLFESLADARPRDVSIDEDRRHLTVEALREWEAHGFPGTWDGWWEEFHAKHVEESKDYAAWLDSGTDLNFHDWRGRRRPGAE